MSRLASVIRPAIEPGRRVIAISDIHGNLSCLKGLLKQVRLTPDGPVRHISRGDHEISCQERKPSDCVLSGEERLVTQRILASSSSNSKGLTR